MGGREIARVGMRDVAALAGVSTQTVSRVLNDYPHIRAETRDRVRAAAAELGYRMNNAARALGTATTRTIGVLASDSELFGPAAGIAALEAAARAEGRWISTAYADGADPVAVREAVEHLLVQGVDGIIVVAPHTATIEVLGALDLAVPLTTLHGAGAGGGGVAGAGGGDGGGAAGGDDRGGSDGGAQEVAAGLAIDHLVDLGHRSIALVGGPADWQEAALRSRGFERALRRRRLAAVGGWAGDWSAHSGAALAAEISGVIRRADGPTAIAVANDQMALGLTSGLRARGVAVPGDVSLTGFDDNPDAGFYRPALTTVRLDIAGEARRCVADLRGAAAAPPLAPQLIVRDSTAPPRR